jgi:transposase-like protein
VYSRRRYTPQFKYEAVQVMNERLMAGLTLQRVSEELEVSPDRLREWGKLVAESPEDATAVQIFPGPGKRRALEGKPRGEPVIPRTPNEELARLRRENERLRMERDFLKKAAAFFAKESQ